MERGSTFTATTTSASARVNAASCPALSGCQRVESVFRTPQPDVATSGIRVVWITHATVKFNAVQMTLNKRRWSKAIKPRTQLRDYRPLQAHKWTSSCMTHATRYLSLHLGVCDKAQPMKCVQRRKASTPHTHSDIHSMRVCIDYLTNTSTFRSISGTKRKRTRLSSQRTPLNFISACRQAPNVRQSDVRVNCNSLKAYWYRQLCDANVRLSVTFFCHDRELQ